MIGMRRTNLLGLSAIAVFSWLGCGAKGDNGDIGGETNWLSICDEDADCGAERCVCGVCTAECTSSGSCADFQSATCALATGSAFSAQCGASMEAPQGLCLPSCEAVDCARGQSCVDGACVANPDSTNPPENPTGSCRAPDSGARFGYHSPEAGQVWLPDCDNPRDREYFRVFLQTDGTAYMIPRPDGSPYLDAACADPEHPLAALAESYTLCGETDIEKVNAMDPADALRLAHYLHERLVFFAGESGESPFAMPSDILDGCRSDEGFRNGPMKERCDFEIAASESGARNEIGWSHTGAEGEALAAKMNELYGITGEALCTLLANEARRQLGTAIRDADRTCETDEDCTLVSHASSCHSSCERAVSTSAQEEIVETREEISASVCRAFEAEDCMVATPICAVAEARCVGGQCTE